LEYPKYPKFGHSQRVFAKSDAIFLEIWSFLPGFHGYCTAACKCPEIWFRLQLRLGLGWAMAIV